MTLKSTQQETLSNIIEDYLIDFNTYSDKGELNTLLVFAEFNNGGLHEIIVQDYPLEHLYEDIRNDEHSKRNVTIGVYDNKPIKFITNKVISNLDSFIEKKSSLYEKAKEKPRYYNKEGDVLDFVIEEGLVEYEPILINKYQLKQNIKTLMIIDGRILTKNYLTK